MINDNLVGGGNIPKSSLVINSDALRLQLLSRNLYTPTKTYPLEPSEIGKIIDTVDSIIDVVSPFKGFNLTNTVIGRLIDDKTPMVKIGLIMLGKQFAYNEISRLSSETYEMIKPSNIFDGNRDTKLFVKNSDFSITSKIRNTGVGQIIANLTSNILSNKNPFTKDSLDSDYFKNTGSGQLDLMFKNVNRNLYTNNEQYVTDYANKTGNSFKMRYSAIRNVFYNFNNDYFNVNSITDFNANSNIGDAYDNVTKNTKEYSSSHDYINKNFGSSISNRVNKDISLADSKSGIENEWINPESGFSNDNINNNIVWGRDNIDPIAKSNISHLLGLSENQAKDNNISQDLKTNFDVNIGLLKYTEQLVNATNGNMVDITRKAFEKKSKIVGFNGSGLWKAPNNSLERFANTTGVRQHSVLDQYDRYAKAIRFDGNHVYKENAGNVHSVIYQSVIPRIHPSFIDDKVNNRNLMFSIENLAIKVISEEGTLEDGTKLPLSEVGQFGGRIMWFPPYNIEINETTLAKYDSTVMVGRGEPIYSYQNSERSANINFTLLIDYPPQLKNSTFTKGNKHKEISEFFAFGIDKDTARTNVKTNTKPVDNTILENITGKPLVVDTSKGGTISNISFPNNVPDEGQINNVFDLMYKSGYEVDETCLPPEGINGTTWGINKTIYSNSSLLDNPAYASPSKFTKVVDTNSISQYDFILDTCPLNQKLIDVYNNEINRKNYKIEIVGAASLLYYDANKQAVYNKDLGLRRAKATENLIRRRLALLYPNNDIRIASVTSEGSANADPSTGLVENILTKDTKLSRNVTISFIYDAVSETKTPQLSATEKEVSKSVSEKNTRITEENNKKLDNNSYIFSTRETSGIDTKLLNGFDAISNNYYVPVFHSQTPEDFHRRLVFLQQCMRQGGAQYKSSPDGVKSIKNSVFGRQPVCIIRIADFMFTKVIIENLNIDYSETSWDMNPEGFGLQPMIAKVTLQVKIIGGQSLQGPINALQNAISYNYYANSTFSNTGIYATPYKAMVDEYGDVLNKKGEINENRQEK